MEEKEYRDVFNEPDGNRKCSCKYLFLEDEGPARDR